MGASQYPPKGGWANGNSVHLVSTPKALVSHSPGLPQGRAANRGYPGLRMECESTLKGLEQGVPSRDATLSGLIETSCDFHPG